MTHKILISPAQRFQLLALTHGESSKIPDGKAGVRYRRFMRAFGITHVSVIAREQGGVRSKYAANERLQHLIEVDDEAVEYALEEIAGKERSALQEDILGDLFDVLGVIKAGLPYVEPTGVRLDLVADTDHWLPEGVKPEGKLLSMSS